MRKIPNGPEDSERLPGRDEGAVYSPNATASWAGILMLTMIVSCLAFEVLREILF